jgi:hypothetical protein
MEPRGVDFSSPLLKLTLSLPLEMMRIIHLRGRVIKTPLKHALLICLHWLSKTSFLKELLDSTIRGMIITPFQRAAQCAILAIHWCRNGLIMP